MTIVVIGFQLLGHVIGVAVVVGAVVVGAVVVGAVVGPIGLEFGPRHQFLHSRPHHHVVLQDFD